MSNVKFSRSLCPYIGKEGTLYYALEMSYTSIDGALYRIINFPDGIVQFWVNLKKQYSPVHKCIMIHFANNDLN